MNNQPNSGHAFEQVAGIWSRRWRLILAVFFIVAIPAMCAVMALPNVYEAQAVVIPVGNSLTQSSTLGGGGESLLDSVTTQVLSRERLAAVIERFNLYPGSKVGAAPPTEAMRKDILVQPRLGKNQQAADAQPYAFSVSYRGSDPQTVAAVANALAASYEKVALDMQQQEATAAVATFKDRLDLVRAKLDSQQKLIDRYRKEHPGELPDQQATNLVAMQRMDNRLRDNEAKQLQLMQRRTGLLQQMQASGESDLTQLEQRLADLKLSYTDKYPEVISVKARIAALKARDGDNPKDTEARTPHERELAGVNADLTQLKREEQQMQSQIALYQSRMDDAPLAAQKLKTLTQGYSETSDLYTSLLKRYDQVQIAHATAAQTGPQYQVLEPAMVPTGASGPGRLRLFVVSLLLGLGLAGLAALIAEQRDTSFHSLEDIRKFTSLAILATIPLISTTADKRKRWLHLGAEVIGIICLVGVLGAAAATYTHTNQSLAQRLSSHMTASDS